MLTHVYLVSSQATPNLTPVLDQAVKPDRVILVVSPGMAQHAQWLEDVLSPRVKVDRWTIQDPYDVEHLQQRILEVLEKESTLVQNQQIILNATGGTKPMSIAAYEAFRAYNLPIFYIHPDKDRLVWLHPSQRQSVDLADRLKIDPFLRAHGVDVRGEPGRNVPDERFLQVGETIVRQLGQYQKALGTINWLAASAEKQLVSAPVKNAPHSLRQLIELFEENSILQQHNNRLHFASEAQRFFVNGGWLEYLVFDAARKRRKQDPHIHDIARSVQVSRLLENQREVRNELDVVFLRDNRLHIIECKTRQFKGQGEDSPGAETLYKLDTLGDVLGGIQARSMLVSYQKLRKADLDRAKSLNITVCHGDQLQQLQQQLAGFVGARFPSP